MNTCPFCPENLNEAELILTNQTCFFMHGSDSVLLGWGMIMPKVHRSTVFDLTAEEWRDSYTLLQEVKALLDQQVRPDGYNIGWNCGEVGGQHVFHAHLHIIPRFQDEPLAGKGIRHWFKQEVNKRPELNLK